MWMFDCESLWQPEAICTCRCFDHCRRCADVSFSWVGRLLRRTTEKKVLDFGPSPYNPPGGPRIRAKLFCYFYATFLVKDYDMGEKGAECLAIVPTRKEVAPACTRSHSQGERVIVGTEWSGYFKGAKGQLVFFQGDDGYNGGLPFAIYDSGTGTKVFEDSVILDS